MVRKTDTEKKSLSLKIILERFELFLEKNTTAVYSLLLIFLGAMTMGFQYTVPDQTQWDEVYYLPVVARYESGSFFMESHPPFGKLLMTLGDVLVGSNKQLDLSTIQKYDAINGGGDGAGAQDDIPVGYSFVGVRLVPVLAGIAVPVVVMALVTLITRRDWIGFLAGGLVVLDNALTLQNRGAMLDSILLLLMLISVYFSVKGLLEYLETKKVTFTTLALATVFAGLAISTKYNAVIVLIPVLLLCLLTAKLPPLKKNTLWEKVDRALIWFSDAWIRSVVCLSAIAIIFVGVFALHFGIARQVNPEFQNNNGYFGASELLKERLKDSGGVIRDGGTLLMAIGSGIQFTVSYHSGVPSFQKCEEEAIQEGKGKVCNGSLPWMWPLMGRSVNFRYAQFAVENATQKSITLEDYNSKTDEEKQNYTVKTSYYTLIGNPVVRLAGLAGLLFSLVYVIYTLIRRFRTKSELSPLFWSILLLVGVYVSYMVLASRSNRILYLYHYFFPFVISLVLFAVSVYALAGEKVKWLQPLLTTLLIAAVAGFLFFAPFTYGLPMSSQEFSWRNWTGWWAIMKVN